MKNTSISMRNKILILSALLMLAIFSAATYTVSAAEMTLSDHSRDGLQATVEASDNTPTTIYISENFSFDGNPVIIPAGANITIRSQGAAPNKLTQTSGRHFIINGSLTLEDIIVDGSVNGTKAAASGGGIDVAVEGVSHGTLIMNKGSIIQNCYTPSGGAGVSVSYGTFTMNDGALIQNCTADSGGGLLSISSAVTIYNGIIKGCKATCGGGVYLTGSNSMFIMYDGIIGDNNTDNGNFAGYGGGIFAVGTNNKIYIGGDQINPAAGGNPRINGNTAYSYGGGVSLGGSDKYIMYHGEINGNRMTESGIYGIGGAGMHLRAGSVFSFLGGTINDNTTVKNGGGVFVNGGIFTMSGTGTITGNTAAINGGGIYGEADYTGVRSTTTVNNGTISSNKSKYGGGVYMDNSIFVMGAPAGSNDHVIIQNNTASYMGGGVDVHNGSTFTMNCGTIRDNQSVLNDDLTYGGGVEVYNGSTFTMKDGLITGNSSMDYSGGVEVYQDSTFTMDGGSITNNSAPRGGGVSVGYESSMFTMNSGNIKDNTASFSGGGVYAYATGSMTATSGAITGNSSPYGGGIFTAVSGKVDVDNCSITNNTATGDGGGIYTSDKSYANLKTGSRTYFKENAAPTEYVPGGDLDAKYPGIQYGNVTVPYSHPLNNYDINAAFEAPSNCHITFDSRGGSGVPDQVKDFGDTVAQPADPVKTGNIFLGWWVIDGNGNWDYKWDFGTVLDLDTHGAELVLHAQWEAQSVTVKGTVSGLPDNSGVEIYYSTDGGGTFNTTTTDADRLYSITVLHDSNLIITPSGQTGYTVNPKSRNITITAENLTDNDFIYKPGEYTVTFESNDKTSIGSQTVSSGKEITKPVDPTKEGSNFVGWYTDNEIFQNEWNFDTDTVTNDITLYAKWAVTTPAETNIPKTGDYNAMVLWILLFFTSITIVAILVKIKKRTK